MEPRLVPGRECGSCNVCCVALTIDDPALQKPQGYRCRNARADNSCAIYEDRPQTCRTYFCGWRLLPWVKESMKPDRSGVLIRLQGQIAADGTRRLGIVVTLLDNAALKAEGLAETTAAAVSAGLPVYVHIPGPPGYTSSQARIDEVLVGPVLARDKAAVLEVLRQARRQGLAGKHEPVRLNRPAEVSPTPP